jgi:hypothetical protein
MENNITYTATSLSDIANHFDMFANRIEERLRHPGRMTQLQIKIHVAETRIWREAAETLRRTTIVEKKGENNDLSAQTY